MLDGIGVARAPTTILFRMSYALKSSGEGVGKSWLDEAGLNAASLCEYVFHLASFDQQLVVIQKDANVL